MFLVAGELKSLLRGGSKAPPQFSWPKDMDEPSVAMHNVIGLMKFHRSGMNHNFTRFPTQSLGYVSGSSTSINRDPIHLTIFKGGVVVNIQPYFVGDGESYLTIKFCDLEEVDP
jgi:inositol hexakisphosphate/diphosphoinositol-pentakisphosphate kinase